MTGHAERGTFDIAGPLLTAEQRTAIVRDAYERGRRAAIYRVADLTAVAATVDAKALRAALEPRRGHGRSYLLRGDGGQTACLWDVAFDDESDLSPVFGVVTAGLDGWRERAA